MHKLLRLGFAALLSSSTSLFSGCSTQNEPEPVQPEPALVMSANATDSSTVATARAWFTQASQQSTQPVSVDWQQARVTGNWVVVPLRESSDVFAQGPQQGLRYVVVQAQNNGSGRGRIVELVLPTKSSSAGQANTLALTGVQPLLTSGAPGHLAGFTGCVFVYSPTYAYETGFLYQNGTAQGQRVRLKVDRATTQVASARGTNPNPATPQNLLQVCETISVVTYANGVAVGGYTTVSCTTVDDGSSGGGGSGWGGGPGGNTGGGGSTGGDGGTTGECRKCGTVLGGDPTGAPTTTLNISLTPCQTAVYTNLTNLQNGMLAFVVRKFGGTATGYNWKLYNGTLPSGQYGATAGYNRASRSITTIFDANQWRNATDLSVARTMLHEAVHAYVLTYFANSPQYAGFSYPDLVAAYAASGAADPNIIHHNMMGQGGWLGDLAWALQQYGQSQGYNLPDQYYADMAWGGLETSQAFLALQQSDKDRIRNLLSVEVSGRDLQGNAQPQNGQPAGCP